MTMALVASVLVAAPVATATAGTIPSPFPANLILHAGVQTQLAAENFTYGIDPPSAPAALLWFEFRLEPAPAAGVVRIGPCARAAERITVAFARNTDTWERLLLPNEPLCATSSTEVAVERMDSGTVGSVSNGGGTWRAATVLIDTAHGVGAKKSKTAAKRVLTVSTPTLGLTAFQVTTTSPGGAGMLYAWPCGAKRPARPASVVRGRDATTGVVFVAPSPSATVCFQSSVSAYLEVQTLASFGVGSALGTGPVRVVDSRAGIGVPKGKVAPGTIFSVGLPGSLAGASYVIVSVSSTWSKAVASGLAPGHCGENYFHLEWGLLIETRTGAAASEQWILPVSPSGSICFGSQYGEDRRAVYDVTVDVVGTIGPSYTPRYGYTS